MRSGENYYSNSKVDKRIQFCPRSLHAIVAVTAITTSARFLDTPRDRSHDVMAHRRSVYTRTTSNHERLAPLATLG